MEADLLHLIATARGIATRDLLAEVATLRKAKVWPHEQPKTVADLQRALGVLKAQGQVVLLPSGWFLASQVPKAEGRRGFEEVTQRGLFA